MDNCIFCKIVNKEIPSEIVYEDEDVIAFKDIHPVTPVHILVIPKAHIKSIMELDEDAKPVCGKIFKAIQVIAKEQNIDEAGFRVISNCGEDAGQVVKHLHFHVLAGKKLGPKIA